jgi:CRP-like cAMP-binding protein
MDDKHLESIPLFSSLSKRERREVARHADEVDVDEGKPLVKEGDCAWEFFAIEDGTAAVLKDRRLVATLGPGDFFGEMGAVDHSARRASVVATSPMTLMVMTDREFSQMARDLPSVGNRIKAAIEERATALTA